MQSLLYLSLGLLLFLLGLAALALHLRSLRAKAFEKRSVSALQELATSLALDVDDFDGQVRTISGGLDAAKPGVVADDVLVAVDQISRASESMRTKLKNSEAKILEQAEAPEDHARAASEQALMGLVQAAGLDPGEEHGSASPRAVVEPSIRVPADLPPATRTLPEEPALTVDECRDSITGLPNRSAFLDDLKIRLATRRSKPGTTCLAMLRIDRFGEMLSERGFRAAETVLMRSAESLTAAMRDGDHAARFDRDTFVIYLSELCPEDAPAAVERLRQCVSQEVEIGSAVPIRVTASSSFAPIEASAEAAQLVACCRGALALAAPGEALAAG